MQFQTFRGSDVREALYAVRKALGADALIESTRHVNNGRGGALNSSFVEIVAAPAYLSGFRGRSAEIGLPSQRPSRRGVLSKPPAAVKSVPTEDVTRLKHELEQLKSMFEQLRSSRSPKDRTRALLHTAGFEGEIAKQLAAGAASAAKESNSALTQYLRERTKERLHIEPKLLERPYRQAICAVGPTGVGKTTTLAKMAAIAKLRLGKSVSVVSLDNYRVGAVEQWERFSELLDVPVCVAHSEEEFRQMIDEQPTDLVFIDTPGRTIGEDSGLERLKECLKTLEFIRPEILLVLPAWLRARDAERIMLAYEDPRLTGLVLTKVDETEQMGGALHAALAGPLPLTYVCNGARIPEDIADADADAIVNHLFPEQA